MKKILILSIFVLVGLAALVFSIYTFKNQIELVRYGIESTGEVIEIVEKKSDDGPTYSPRIEYLYGGVTRDFVSRLSSSSSSYRVGDTVNILIPKNGKSPQINSFEEIWLMPILMFFFGIIFFTVGIFAVKMAIKTNKNVKKLESDGVVVKATNPVVIDEIEKGFSTTKTKKTGISMMLINFARKNKSIPKVVKAQWLDEKNNKVYIFFSDSLKYDPTEYLDDTVDVRILPYDPNVYRFENLPKLGTDKNFRNG